MANLRNEFEFRSALLTALGQEHTEAEAKNEEMWRRKMLDGLGVEYDQNDVNQFGLFRENLIEGVTSKSEGGGGGESDFSIATLTFTNGEGGVIGSVIAEVDNRSSYNAFDNTIKIILYKGQALIEIDGTIESTSGNIEDLGRDGWLVTGDCTVTVSGGSPE